MENASNALWPRLAAPSHASRTRVSRLRGGRITMLALLLVVAIASNHVSAAPLDLPFPSSKRKAAVERIQWDRLPPDVSERLRPIVDRPTVFRQMETKKILCDADMFRFLVRYPEVVVNIWQLMGITKVTAQRTAPFEFSANDGAGTKTNVELVYGDDSTHIMLCEGLYQGHLFKRIMRGRCVLVLRSEFGKDESGATVIANKMDMFLQVDDLGLDMLTRTLHPLLGKSADRNFIESVKFVQRVSQTAEANGPGMQRLAMRMPNIQPDVRTRFANLSMDVHRRHLNRAMEESPSQPVQHFTAKLPTAGGRLPGKTPTPSR